MSREGGQVRAAEAGRRGSVGHVEVFRMDGVGTSIVGRPRRLSADRRARPTYTLTWEEPVNCKKTLSTQIQSRSTTKTKKAAQAAEIIDNQGAHNTMADYFFSDGPGVNGVVLALADAFYEAALEEKV